MKKNHPLYLDIEKYKTGEIRFKGKANMNDAELLRKFCERCEVIWPNHIAFVSLHWQVEQKWYEVGILFKNDVYDHINTPDENPLIMSYSNDSIEDAFSHAIECINKYKPQINK